MTVAEILITPWPWLAYWFISIGLYVWLTSPVPPRRVHQKRFGSGRCGRVGAEEVNPSGEGET